MNKEIESKARKDFDRILEESFDFGKVYKMMQAVEWTYYDSKRQTPTVDRMKQMLWELLDECIDDLYSKDNPDYSIIGTGGFEVTVDNSGYIRVTFVGEDSDSEVLE
jgi:hypothetical protein